MSPTDMFLPTKKATVHYKIIGQGMPLVILHGYCLDHRVMTGCLEPIFQQHKGFKRIYLDLPGMGLSQEVSGIASSADIFAAVHALISKIVGKKKYGLVGYSYGGYLAQCLVATRPQKIAGLCLMAPAVFPSLADRTLPLPQVIVNSFRPKHFAGTDERELYADLVVRTKKVWQTIKTHMLPGYQIRNRELLEKIFQTDYAIPVGITKLKSLFNKPTLFLLGKQDHVVGYHDPLMIMPNYPKATVAVLDRAGHNLMFEQPALFRALFEEWLKRVK